MCSCLNNRGIANFRIGNHKAAIEILHRRLRIGEDIGIKSMTSMSLGNIANVHYTQGNFSSALEYNKRRYTSEKN